MTKIPGKAIIPAMEITAIVVIPISFFLLLNSVPTRAITPNSILSTVLDPDDTVPNMEI